MLQVGLTGGIASGKSTVARMFASVGAVVIDADQVARDVVAPGTPGLEAVVAEFGDGVRTSGGELDRAAVAELVFGDGAALARLNAIVHPLVRERTQAQVAAAPAQAIVVHDVPLIVENDMGDQYHLVVVVGASPQVRLERAVARGLDRDQVLARMVNQASDDQRRQAADVWLANEGTTSALEQAVAGLWHGRISGFAKNLRQGRAAVPVAGSTQDGDREQQLARLLARVRRAGAGVLQDFRGAVNGGVLSVQARAVAPVGDALLGAGFVPVGEG
ncbi:MAG: dephospho-CoA kinase, partial [Beutenbergiaceae bacterium]